MNKFHFDEDRLEYIERLLNKKFIKVRPQKIPHITSDLPDNKILEAASEAKVDFLITGDRKHILKLRKIGKTKIVSAEEFLTYATSFSTT